MNDRHDIQDASATDVVDPAGMLACLDAGQRKAALPAEVAELVRRALRERTWPTLSVASRALRVLQRFAAEDRAPVPVSVTESLSQVRRCMAELKAGR